MSRYRVILNNGKIINVPNDKARTKYEYISIYGMRAVLARAYRSHDYRQAVVDSDAYIRVIVCPNGEEITQF